MDDYKKLIRVKNQDTFITLLKANFLKKPPPPKPIRSRAVKELPRVTSSIKATSVLHEYINRRCRSYESN